MAIDMLHVNLNVLRARVVSLFETPAPFAGWLSWQSSRRLFYPNFEHGGPFPQFLHYELDTRDITIPARKRSQPWDYRKPWHVGLITVYEPEWVTAFTVTFDEAARWGVDADETVRLFHLSLLGQMMQGGV